MTKFTIAEARDYACRRIFGKTGFAPISPRNNSKFQQDKVDAQYLYATARLEAQGIILGDMRSDVACISRAELDVALDRETGIARTGPGRPPATRLRVEKAMKADLEKNRITAADLRTGKTTWLASKYRADAETVVAARDNVLR